MVKQRIMWTILLDIDGTLIRTRGAGLNSIQIVMHRHFGVTELPKLQVHGCTDVGIWTELFQKLGIQMPKDISPLVREYCEVLKPKLAEYSGEVLSGVVDFLESLDSNPEVAAGLLTGNAQQAAWIKMEHFGLDKYVQKFGGFGDFDANRNDVARRAFESASAFQAAKFDPAKLWVIGDTVNDITCARSIGAKVMVVETGGSERAALEAAQPDVLVKDLTIIDCDSSPAGFL